MKSKYKEIYKNKLGNMLIKIVQSKSFYVVQYCKYENKDFNRNARRYKSKNLEDIKSFFSKVFNVSLDIKDLSKINSMYWF